MQAEVAEPAGEPEPTGFEIPRTELGATAVRLPESLMAGSEPPDQLVACALRPGATAAAPPG